MNVKTKIFVSYSHKDEEHYNELMRHLKVVSDSMNLEVWSDQKIEIGDKLDPNIQENLVKADIVICLVSTDYLTSHYYPKFLLNRPIAPCSTNTLKPTCIF